MKNSAWMWGLVAVVLVAPGMALGQDAPSPEEVAEAASKGGGGEEATPKRVAVTEVQVGENIDARVGKVVGEALLAEVRKREMISAIGTAEIQDMLSFEAERQLLGCGDDSCMAEIAGALGVDELVTGNLSKVGDSHIIKITRIDIINAKVMGTFNKRLVAGDGEEFFATIGPAIEELYGHHPLRDGKKAGVDSAIAAKLNPPPIPQWAFWTTTGGAVAAGAVGGFFALSFWDAQTEYKNLVALAQVEPQSGRTVVELGKKVESRATARNIAWGAAGGLVLVAAIEGLFTDWHGAANAFKDDGGAVADVVVTPTGVALVLW